MPRPKSRVRPARVRYKSKELRTTVQRVIGHRGECDCAAYFPIRDTPAEARKDVRWHRLYHEAGSRVSLAGPV